MLIRELSKPAWDAALFAARTVVSGNPDIAAHRAAYREARASLVALLPTDADATDLINQALRWETRNAIAAACAGLPIEGAMQ